MFPLQQEDINTEASRNNPWHLLVALDDAQSATGELFVDDGTSQQTVQNGAYFLVSYTTIGSSTKHKTESFNYRPTLLFLVES